MPGNNNFFDFGPNQNVVYTAFLKAVRLHAERMCTSKLMLPENLNVFVNDIPDETARVMTMELLMAIQSMEKLATHDLPANRWELAKEYFLPSWLKRRYPVRKVRYELEVKAYYPDIIVDRKAETQLYVTKKEVKV